MSKIAKINILISQLQLIIFLFCLGILSSCSNKQDDGSNLIIACAASTQFALDELASEFETKNGIEIEIISSSSGKLSQLILNGAPYDIFFSADRTYIQYLQLESDICRGEEIIYGSTKLALYCSEEFNQFKQADSLLRSIALSKIAIADPASAPIGKLAMNYLEKESLIYEVQEKLVYGNSIAQVNQYLEKGLCDAGFVSLAVIKAGVFSKTGTVYIFENYSIQQSAIILSMADERGNLESAEKFMDFLMNDPSAQKIMEKYGYR